jgi:hypothetical protein
VVDEELLIYFVGLLSGPVEITNLHMRRDALNVIIDGRCGLVVPAVTATISRLMISLMHAVK